MGMQQEITEAHIQRFDDALSSGNMELVRSLYAEMVQWWANVSNLAADNTFRTHMLEDALLKAPQLYEAAYQFGQYHRKRDSPLAREACLYLMGQMLSALPEHRRSELEFGGDVALEVYEQVRAAKRAAAQAQGE